MNSTDEYLASPTVLKIYDFMYSTNFKIMLGSLWSLLVLFGVLGNGLVILISIIYKKLNDITNCYIFNLAITDLLFVLFCIPFTTFLYLDYDWRFGVTLCKLNHFISHASVQSTCLTLTAMTIYRCNLIISNENYKNRNPHGRPSRGRRNVLFVTILIWTISFILSSPDLIFYTVQYHHDNGTYIGECSIKVEAGLGNFYKNISHYLSVVTTYIIPLAIIILSYARLLSYLSKNQKELGKFNEITHHTETAHMKLTSDKSVRNQSQIRQPNKSMVNKSKTRRRKVTKMVAVVTLNFAICWLPTHLFIIIKLLFFTSESDLPLNVFTALSLFKQFAHTLSYLTPVINPCLYAFFNDNFRSSIILFFKRMTCRKQLANRHLRR